MYRYQPKEQVLISLAQQLAIVDGIKATSCGLTDVVCVCKDDSFLNVLQTSIATGCSRHDQETTLSVARELCVAAVPSFTGSKQSSLVAVISFLMALATVAVLLRFSARSISVAKVGVDDYLIFVALLLTYGLNVTSFISIKSGTGKHMITLTLDQITTIIKASSLQSDIGNRLTNAQTDEATQVLFGCSITVIKISILFFYSRLFPFRSFRVAAIITGGVEILWWIGLMLTAFLHCRPLAYYWDRSIPNGYCTNDNLIGYTITSVNIVTDVIVLLMPLPWLWGLQLNLTKRLAIIGLFVLGSLYFSESVCVAGIVRIPLLAHLALSDLSWTGISVGIWVNVECNIGIVSACLPILRPLFTEKYPSSPAAFLSRFLRSISSTVPSDRPSQSLGSDSTAQSQKQEKQRDEEKAEMSDVWSRTNEPFSSKRRLWGSDSTVVENLSMSAELHGGRLREHCGWYRNIGEMGTIEMQGDDEIKDHEQVLSAKSGRDEGPWGRSESPTSFKSDKWDLMPSKARWNRGSFMQ
ncbi:MAG: hypothetical protein LQ342_003594 [Letrouitia transgressa]|nr:MAG: hypothetical protein LQ342_003594 [Letrouitia transgressa]